jgi:hypothetical protein
MRKLSPKARRLLHLQVLLRLDQIRNAAQAPKPTGARHA